MLRPISDSDGPIIDDWIARDPLHSAQRWTADFFHQPDSMNFAVEDKTGPIMFVRVEPLDAEIVRLYTQFAEDEPRRTAVALARDFPTVRDLIRKSGVRYLVFNSVSPTLIAFFTKRFGFVHLPDSNDYFLDLKAG